MLSHPTFLRTLFIIAFLSFATAVQAKDKWIIRETENLNIYSNASPLQTQKTAADLLRIQETLSIVFPRITDKRDKKLRLFICKNQRSIKKFSSLYEGKPKEIGGLFTQDPEGDIIVISAEGDLGQTRSIIYHEYIHFLTSTRKFYIPTWLSEGIAETFASIEFTKKGAKVGLPLSRRVPVLRGNKLIPLERFFKVTRGSPEYNSSDHGRGIFYAQSWCLVHYLLYGKNDLPQDAAAKLIGVALKEGSIDEATFTQICGYGFKQMEKRLNRYINSGKYTYQIYTLKETETKTIDLADASEGEVELIYGMLLLRMRGPEEAYSHILRAYDMLPDSSRAAAYMGYYLYRQKLFKDAAESFGEAIDRNSKVPATYLYKATSTMRARNPKRRLNDKYYDKKETAQLLKSLFKARALGEKRKELYHRIAEVWVGSRSDAELGHIGVILEGFKLYPKDLYIQYCLASLYIRINELEDAQMIIDYAFANPGIAKRQRNFENLKKRLERKQSAAQTN